MIALFILGSALSLVLGYWRGFCTGADVTLLEVAAALNDEELGKVLLHFEKKGYIKIK